MPPPPIVAQAPRTPPSMSIKEMIEAIRYEEAVDRERRAQRKELVKALEGSKKKASAKQANAASRQSCAKPKASAQKVVHKVGKLAQHKVAKGSIKKSKF